MNKNRKANNGKLRKAKKTGKRGFSLFESLASLSTFSLITLVGLGSIQVTQKVHHNLIETTTSNDRLQRVMEVITRDLREARTSYVSSCGNTTTSYDATTDTCIADHKVSGCGGDTVAPYSTCFKFISFRVPEATVNETTTYKTVRYSWFDQPVTQNAFTTHWLRRIETPSNCNTQGCKTITEVDKDIDSASFQYNSGLVTVTLTKDGRSMTSSVFLRNPDL
jgi:type II secretory pathway component PulJ